jgi:ankyrin repeat protein
MIILRNNYLLNIKYKNNLILRLSAEKGCNNIIKLLMRRNIDTSCNNNEAFIIACENGNEETVNILLYNDKTNPAARNNEALYIACINNHIEIVKRLLQDSRVDPSCRHNVCLTGTITNGYYEIAKLLIDWHYRHDKLSPKELSMFELLFEKKQNEFNRQKINNTIDEIIDFRNKASKINYGYINKDLMNDIYIEHFKKNKLTDFEISIVLNDLKNIYNLV